MHCIYYIHISRVIVICNKKEIFSGRIYFSNIGEVLFDVFCNKYSGCILAFDISDENYIGRCYKKYILSF